MKNKSIHTLLIMIIILQLFLIMKTPDTESVALSFQSEQTCVLDNLVCTYKTPVPTVVETLPPTSIINSTPTTTATKVLPVPSSTSTQMVVFPTITKTSVVIPITTKTQVVAPTVIPTLAPTSSGTRNYMIINGNDFSKLSTSGSAWTSLKLAADSSPGNPDLCNQDNRIHPQTALASALVYAKTGTQSYKDKAKNLILSAYPTQKPGCGNAVLSLGRQLGAYVIAADLIDLNDSGFTNWLTEIRNKNIGGHSRWYVLRDTAYNSSNNWGTFALSSIIAADIFLKDGASLAIDWKVFEGYGIAFGWPFEKTSGYQESWSCVASNSTSKLPISINTSCTKNGYNLDGAPVEDASRTNFPAVGNYPAEAAQGLVVSALLLGESGYHSWTINNSQIKRVAEFRERFNNLNYSSADYYVQWIVNSKYGMSQITKPAGFGRIFGFTDWLFP